VHATTTATTTAAPRNDGSIKYHYSAQADLTKKEDRPPKKEKQKKN
jgi:hypothetical protein